jgi:hypothetical protein
MALKADDQQTLGHSPQISHLRWECLCALRQRSVQRYAPTCLPRIFDNWLTCQPDGLAHRQIVDVPVYERQNDGVAQLACESKKTPIGRNA